MCIRNFFLVTHCQVAHVKKLIMASCFWKSAPLFFQVFFPKQSVSFAEVVTSENEMSLLNVCFCTDGTEPFGGFHLFVSTLGISGKPLVSSNASLFYFVRNIALLIPMDSMAQLSGSWVMLFTEWLPIQTDIQKRRLGYLLVSLLF